MMLDTFRAMKSAYERNVVSMAKETIVRHGINNRIEFNALPYAFIPKVFGHCKVYAVFMNGNKIKVEFALNDNSKGIANFDSIPIEGKELIVDTALVQMEIHKPILEQTREQMRP